MEDLVNKIKELYESEFKNQPFDVLNSLGIHENNHSRLLCELLKHNNKALLTYFVTNVLGIDIEFGGDVEIEALKYNIDILINDNTKAIIIENKIYWAKDQYNQILNYIKTVVGKKAIPRKKIYVVYLTSDGKKKIKNLGDEDGKKELKELEDSGRFKQVNYRDNILPWLSTIAESNCNLNVYISYLESHITGTNPVEHQIFKNIFQLLVNNNQFEFKQCLELYEKEKGTIKDEKNMNAYSFVRWILNNKLYDYLATFFCGFENDKPWFRKRGDELYILFFKNEWNTEWYIHFEYILNTKDISLRLEIHFEKPNSDKRVKSMKKVFQTSGLSESIDISLNDDLTIDENNRQEINSFIEKTTAFIDNQLKEQK
jgi:hypothetical protein